MTQPAANNPNTDPGLAKEDLTATVLDSTPARTIIAELVQKEMAQQSQAPMPPPEVTHFPEQDAMVFDPAQFGAVIDEKAKYSDFGHKCVGTITFDTKVFPLRPEDRAKIYAPRKPNLAAGPRVISLPAMGEFMPNMKSFRGVPYRTVPKPDIGNVAMKKVDW